MKKFHAEDTTLKNKVMPHSRSGAGDLIGMSVVSMVDVIELDSPDTGTATNTGLKNLNLEELRLNKMKTMKE
jgi:hypothetical protein